MSVRASIVLLLAWAGRAAGEASVEDVELNYVAPDGCGSPDEFFSQLATRASVRRVASAARSFDVTIRPYEAGGLQGRLVVRTAQGDTARSLDGQTCEEVVVALAVVAALAVDGAPAEVAATIRASPPSRVRTDSWFVVGGGVELTRGVTPSAVFGAQVFVEVSVVRSLPLRITFMGTSRQRETLTAGASEFRWLVGRADAQPFAWKNGPLTVSLAAGFEAGALNARGTTVEEPASETRPWIAPIAAARIGVAIGRVQLHLEGVVATPLIRDRFFLAPATTVHQPSRVTGGVGVALAVKMF